MKGQSGKTPETNSPARQDRDILHHELGNVLNGLYGMADLLATSGLNAEQQRWIQAIRRSGQQLGALAAAQDTACANVNPGFVDGIELLEQVITSHFPAAHAAGNDLCLEVRRDLPRYWRCDPCLLRQVLDNLLGNAVKFTPQGAVGLEVDSGSSQEGRGLVLRVTDTGAPLGAVEASNIFKANHRGRNAVDCAGQGLGLFVCKRTVKAMKGSIRWCAGPTAGNCFELVLPGAFPETGKQVLPQTALLAGMQCRLHAAAPYRASVGSFLDRLGVSWRHEKGAGKRPGGGRPVVCISGAADWRRQGEVPVLEVGLRGYDAPSRCLRAPFLPSTLGPALLEQAFWWLSSGEKPGSIPGPSAAGRPGARDPHPE